MRFLPWVCSVLMVAATMLASVLPAEAQYFGRNKVQYDDFDFRVLETEHFEIYYYPEAETAVRDAARMAERWYQRHAQTFLHRFGEKKPIILYANDADFQQTNVIQSTISPGTGGFTESVRERVVMPLTGTYGGTDHVLGHELVHSFQYDLAFGRGDGGAYNLRLVPLWLVEGMAEYLTLGRHDPHTAMWMRDAALRDDLPSIRDLSDPRAYFPYRYGQALLAYVGGKYGDQAVTNWFKMSGRVGVDSSAVFLFGISADSLAAEWGRAVKEHYLPLVNDRTPADSLGRRVLAEDINGGRLNIAPTLSPDGRYVAFLSERELFNVNLFVADAQTGKVLTKLGKVGTTGEFDAIRFLNSAGTWDPNGRRLAFITFAEGDNELSIWNVEENDIEQSFRIDGVTALVNPAWSPDGSKIAVAGMDGGISDLYVLDLDTKNVRQLTNDRYADLQPTWSPDGSTIAFTTDRGRTDLQTLQTTQRMQLAEVNVETGQITLREPFPRAHHHNPQYAPDGRSLYFISDADGFKDVYRMERDSEALFRVTHLQTGVSGITASSPALSVARQSGDVMVSVYSDGRYTGIALRPEDARGTPLPPPDAAPVATADSAGSDGGAPDSTAADTLVAGMLDLPGAPSSSRPPPAGVLPPYTAAGSGLVAAYLDDANTGLPPGGSFVEDNYSPRLTLEGIFPPSFGVSVGGGFGTGVAGGVGLRFGDMLGNQQLDLILQANGTLRDIGGGVSYLNRGSRFNYGLSASHIPVILGVGFFNDAATRSTNRIIQRLFVTQSSVTGSYPLTSTQRLEVGVGGARYALGYQIDSLDPFTGRILDLDADDLGLRQPNPEYVAFTTLAYVLDFSDFGFTSPVRGGRARLQAQPVTGSATYVGLLADLRRYAFVRPFTFAFQAVHRGNYGADPDDLFAEEYLGYSFGSGFVRGYSFNSFERSDCTATTASTCVEADRLVGTHVAKLSTEIRIPVLGARPLSLLDFPYVPTEITLFADAGVAWTAEEAPTFDFDPNATGRTPVTSIGIGARLNILGAIILHPYYAHAFQRPRDPGQFGLLLLPGW